MAMHIGQSRDFIYNLQFLVKKGVLADALLSFALILHT